jgi:hypothetical protein
VDIAGITTAATLRATTGIVTSLTAGSLTSLSDVKVGSGVTLSPDGDIFAIGISTFTKGIADTYTTTTSISPHIRVRNQQGADNIYGGIQLRADRNNGAASVFNIACLTTSNSYESPLVLQSRNSDGNFSEKARITSGGGVGVGTTNPDSRIHVYTNEAAHLINVERASNLNSTIKYENTEGNMFAGLATDAEGWGIDDDGDIGSAPMFFVAKATGNVGINTISPDAKLEVRDSSATGIIIRCTNTQSTHTNKAIRIRNNSDTDTFAVSHTGKVFPLDNIVMANGKGIDFAATSDASGMTSELLDDYEEGSFTPTLTTENSLLSASYTSQDGKYTRIGRMVYFQIYIRLSSKSGGSGQLRVSNLPFSASSATGAAYGGAVAAYTFNWDNDALDRMMIGAGSDQVQLFVGTNSGTNVNAGAGNLNNDTQMRVFGHYHV